MAAERAFLTSLIDGAIGVDAFVMAIDSGDGQEEQEDWHGYDGGAAPPCLVSRSGFGLFAGYGMVGSAPWRRDHTPPPAQDVASGQQDHTPPPPTPPHERVQ